MKEQMKKDIKVLMDVSRAADGPGAAAMEGLVRFEGAFLSAATQEATIVLEYMNGGSLEDVKRRVRPPGRSMHSCSLCTPPHPAPRGGLLHHSCP